MFDSIERKIDSNVFRIFRYGCLEVKGVCLRIQTTLETVVSPTPCFIQTAFLVSTLSRKISHVIFQLKIECFLVPLIKKV